MHIRQADEHGKALGAFVGLAEAFGPVGSVLDVGAGTGRAIEKLKARWPKAKIIGIEPADALREVGHKKGIGYDELVAGDALDLEFRDDSFDFVIETGALHHIKTPIDAVKEMARVADLLFNAALDDRIWGQSVLRIDLDVFIMPYCVDSAAPSLPST